jgi:hypothetical protein
LDLAVEERGGVLLGGRCGVRRYPPGFSSPRLREEATGLIGANEKERRE